MNALSRRRNKKSGDPGKKIPPWKYEAQMSFLLPYLDSRNTESNITGDVNSTEDIEVEQEPNDVHEDGQEAGVGTEEYNESQAVLNRDAKTPSRSQNAGKNTKRTSTQDSLKDMADAMKENANLRKRKLECKEQEKKTAYGSTLNMDDTDMFFMSMSKSIKTLPFLEQIRIKKLLSNEVFDAQMSQSSQNENHQAAFSSPPYAPHSYSIISSENSTGSTSHSNYTTEDGATIIGDARPTLLQLTNLSMFANNYNNSSK